MKLARTFLAALTVCTLAACADSPTAPLAEPATKPAANGETCGTMVKEIQPDGTVVYRCSPVLGSGG